MVESASSNYDGLWTGVGQPRLRKHHRWAMTAVVEAQAHAAETSIEFINEVGLTFEDGRITPIKTVFSYQKESTDEQGVTRSRTHNIEVPVLAIVPSRTWSSTTFGSTSTST